MSPKFIFCNIANVSATRLLFQESLVAGRSPTSGSDGDQTGVRTDRTAVEVADVYQIFVDGRIVAPYIKRILFSIKKILPKTFSSSSPWIKNISKFSLEEKKMSSFSGANSLIFPLNFPLIFCSN